MTKIVGQAIARGLGRTLQSGHVGNAAKEFSKRQGAMRNASTFRNQQSSIFREALSRNKTALGASAMQGREVSTYGNRSLKLKHLPQIPAAKPGDVLGHTILGGKGQFLIDNPEMKEIFEDTAKYPQETSPTGVTVIDVSAFENSDYVDQTLGYQKHFVALNVDATKSEQVQAYVDGVEKLSGADASQIVDLNIAKNLIIAEVDDKRARSDPKQFANADLITDVMRTTIDVANDNGVEAPVAQHVSHRSNPNATYRQIETSASEKGLSRVGGEDASGHKHETHIQESEVQSVVSQRHEDIFPEATDGHKDHEFPHKSYGPTFVDKADVNKG